MIQEHTQQRYGDLRNHFAGNDIAALHHQIQFRGLEERLILLLVLPRDQEQVRFELARGHYDREVVGIIVGTCDYPHRLLDATFLQGHCFCATPAYGPFRGQIYFRIGFNDRGFNPFESQELFHRLAKTTITAQHIAPGRWKHRLVQGRSRRIRQPLLDHVLGWGMQSHRQTIGENVKRIDDGIGTERFHVHPNIVILRAANHGEVIVQKFAADCHFQVDLVVTGERQDAGTQTVFQTRVDQGLWVRTVCAQCRYEHR